MDGVKSNIDSAITKIVNQVRDLPASSKIIGGAFAAYLLYKFSGYIKRKPKSLKGKIIFITGAANGIGRELALLLSREGARIAVTDIELSKANEVVDQIQSEKGEAIAIYCDVSSLESIKIAASVVRTHFGNPNILINNAGMIFEGLITRVSTEKINKIFEVNVISQFYTIKEFLPDMINANEGHVVTMGSFSGLFTTGVVVPYCSTKHAVVGLASGLRDELDLLNSKVKTTLIMPGLVDTRFCAHLKEKAKNKGAFQKVEDVAKRIVQAIKYDEEWVSIPEFGNAFIVLKALVSAKTFNRIIRSLGENLWDDLQ